jgi:hypothetical protein
MSFLGWLGGMTVQALRQSEISREWAVETVSKMWQNMALLVVAAMLDETS